MNNEVRSEAKCPNCAEVVCSSNKDIDQAVINIVAFHYSECKNK